jgi:hypothetical protein
VRRSWLPSRPTHAFAAGLLIGLGVCAVVAVLLLQSASVPFPVSYDDTRRPYGAMMADGDAKLLSSQCVPLEFDQVFGGACIEHVENGVSVHLGLSAPEEVQVVLQYDEHLRFEGYTALDDGAHTLNVRTNEAELKHSGDCDYNLHFVDDRSTGSPIRLRVLASEDVLFETSISPEG